MFRMPTRKLIQFLQRVATATRAGVDARRMWTSEASRGSAAHQRHVGAIRQSVLSGGSVADGMRASRGYFPPLLVQMVDIGEQTGQLDAVLFRLAEYYEHQTSTQRMLLFGIAWPMLQLVGAVLVIGLLIWALGFVAGMRGGEPMDVLGIGLVGTSGAIIWLLLNGLAAAAVIGLGFAVARGVLGPKPVLLAMRVPLIGKALESFALSRLTWTLATALESGMDAKRSVELAVDSTQNVYYAAHRPSMSAAIVRGQEFHEAFAATGAFPEDFIQAVETAEMAGATHESLLQLTKQYEQKAQTSLKLLTGVLTVAIFVGVGVLLTFLIFRLAMVLYIGPIYDALEQV